ncbi:hypothetical protein GCM10007216_06460 [Thalassobacillus devorans]|uniref:Uncharacterized protein n=1 Tax=Thalassobacillus devorans TaxID=279813 RepID=A0ABQ1NJE2_9BACI|nr:hypothetical protein GCM10007216_06460 [Thalassobacillus devorans]
MKGGGFRKKRLPFPRKAVLYLLFDSRHLFFVKLTETTVADVMCHLGCKGFEYDNMVVLMVIGSTEAFVVAEWFIANIVVEEKFTNRKHDSGQQPC